MQLLFRSDVAKKKKKIVVLFLRSTPNKCQWVVHCLPTITIEAEKWAI